MEIKNLKKEKNYIVKMNFLVLIIVVIAITVTIIIAIAIIMVIISTLGEYFMVNNAYFILLKGKAKNYKF